MGIPDILGTSWNLVAIVRSVWAIQCNYTRRPYLSKTRNLARTSRPDHLAMGNYLENWRNLPLWTWTIIAVMNINIYKPMFFVVDVISGTYLYLSNVFPRYRPDLSIWCMKEGLYQGNWEKHVLICNILMYILMLCNRRKFRSYTSDNMDSWKAEVRRVRREKIRRKKM